MTVASNDRTAKGIILASVWLGVIYTALQRSSDATQVIGPYSKNLFIALIIYVCTAVAVTVITLRPPSWLAEVGTSITRRPAWPVGVAALAFIFCAISTIQPQIKLFPIICLLLFVWLLNTNVPPKPIHPSIWLAIGGLVALALLAQLLVLLDVPPVYLHDEGAYSRIGFDYFRTGMLSGDIYGFPPRHFIGFGSWLVTLAYWFKIVGFGWWTGRLYSFVLSCLALPFIYLAGVRFFRSRTSGIAAVGFMSVTISFVETHRVRPDAPMIFLLSLSLFTFSLLDQHPGQKRWPFLLGMFAVLMLEAHLIALAFWAAFGAFLGIQWLSKIRTERRIVFPSDILFYVLGGLLPAIVFFLTHLAPDWGLPSEIVLSPQRFDSTLR